MTGQNTVRTVYTAPVGAIIQHHSLQFHLYADDTQRYVTFNLHTPASLTEAKQRVVVCIPELHTQMICNRLQFNDDKTEALLLCKHRLRHRMDMTTIEVGNTSVTFGETAHNLGAIFDSVMDMRAHVSSLCRSGYMNIWTIRHI